MFFSMLRVSSSLWIGVASHFGCCAGLMAGDRADFDPFMVPFRAGALSRDAPVMGESLMRLVVRWRPA
jgi:hypothetical protein